MRPYGPQVDFVLSVLETLPAYHDYRAGRLSRDEYVAALDANAEEIIARFDGRPGYLDVAKCYPPDFDASAEAILASLVDDGFFGELPEAPYNAYRAHIRTAYDHDVRRTSIHPDDQRLAYFVSMAVKPKRLLVVGAYYGYWTVWAMPGVVAADGHAVLIDPDTEASALAKKNFDALGYGARTTIQAEKAEDVLMHIEPGLDMVMLDAAGPYEHPDLAYRAKGIYGFLVEPIWERMRDGALLVVHNDAPHDGERSERELDRFHAFCAAHFRKSIVTDTPEGVGFYLK